MNKCPYFNKNLEQDELHYYTCIVDESKYDRIKDYLQKQIEDYDKSIKKCSH